MTFLPAYFSSLFFRFGARREKCALQSHVAGKDGPGLVGAPGTEGADSHFSQIAQCRRLTQYFSAPAKGGVCLTGADATLREADSMGEPFICHERPTRPTLSRLREQVASVHSRLPAVR